MKILILFGGDLHLLWGRAQNLAEQLVNKGHEVLYLNRALSLKEKRTPEIHSDIQKLPDFFGFPVLQGSLFCLLDSLKMLWYLEENKKRLTGVEHVIFYGIPNPQTLGVLVNHFKHCTMSYDCADDKYHTFKDLVSAKAGEKVREWERELFQYIQFSSTMNLELKKALSHASGKEVLLVPNGIDPENFQRIKKGGRERSTRYRGVYAGAINHRLNAQKIAEFLAENPECHIDFYGNEDRDFFENFKGEPRVKYCGYCDYERLGEVMGAYDFGMLPYKNLASIQKSSPLKIYQYLNVGLPVIAFYYDNIPEQKGMLLWEKGKVQIENIKVPEVHELHEFHWAQTTQALHERLCGVMDDA